MVPGMSVTSPPVLFSERGQMMLVHPVKRVLVVGGGTMGQQIGLQCATYGFEVVLNDVSDHQLELAQEALVKFASQMMQDLELSRTQVDAALARIQYISDPVAAAKDADLLSECVPEDMWLKRQVFGQYHELCPPHTLFTTNTSTFLPREIVKSSKRRNRFAVLHFHPNVWDASVVDLMPTRMTAPEVTEALRQFAIAIGQIPIVFRKQHRGFVMNTFLFGCFRHALSMVAREIASPEDIDRAFMGTLKSDAGPFGLIDRVGLDTMLEINSFWCKRFLLLPYLEPVNWQNRRLLKSYIARGHLGIKSGQGFYSYPDPAFQQPEFLARKTVRPEIMDGLKSS